LEGNTAERRHAKFIPGGLTFQQTREPMLTDTFDEWLARVVCYAFSVPPLPFVSQVNRASATSATDAALNEGLAPLMGWIKDTIDRVIEQFFGYHEEVNRMAQIRSFQGLEELPSLSSTVATLSPATLSNTFQFGLRLH
jgi:hypothetical protein